MKRYILAIDQGTTSSRAIVFDEKLEAMAVAQQEFTQIFPQSGWVEHNPDEIWSSTLDTCRAAVEKAGIKSGEIAGIGITNQRETTIVWDRKTGRAVHNAIVWQDRRTSDYCEELRAQGHNDTVTAKTGLLIDPYFSATKIRWILEHQQGAEAAGRSRGACFWHGRQLFVVETDRRICACNRCNQRGADHAFQYP